MGRSSKSKKRRALFLFFPSFSVVVVFDAIRLPQLLDLLDVPPIAAFWRFLFFLLFLKRSRLVLSRLSQAVSRDCPVSPRHATRVHPFLISSPSPFPSWIVFKFMAVVCFDQGPMAFKSLTSWPVCLITQSPVS